MDTCPRLRSRASLVAAALVLGTSCTEEEPLVDGLFTHAEWEKIQTLSPLPDLPDDPTNRHADDPAAAAFGQRLFFEAAYSGPLMIGDDGKNGATGAAGDQGTMSCASCHSGPWLIDERSKPGNVSLGAAYLPRNAGSLVNAAHYFPWIENDGLLDSLWSECMIDVEFDLSFNSSRLRLAHVLYEKHRDEYNAVFDPDLDPALDPAHPEAARFPAEGRPGSAAWGSMTPADQAHVTRAWVNFGKAIHAYLNLLVSGDAPFDRYVAGDTGALSPAAKRGLKLFVGKAACDACHSGPDLSDHQFHNTGVEQAVGEHVPEVDEGRYTDVGKLLKNVFRGDGEFSDDPTAGAEKLRGLAQDEADRGKFRTKSLRGVPSTGPYLHNGSLATLEEVVHFYNVGGAEGGYAGTKDPRMVPLNLTATEEADLVALLRSLSGEAVPDALKQDTSAP